MAWLKLDLVPFGQRHPYQTRTGTTEFHDACADEHDPVDYKKLEVGANYLTGDVQPITLYT